MDCRPVNAMWNPYVNLGERILVNDYDQKENSRIKVETATINAIDSSKCGPTEHSCSNNTDGRNSLLLKHSYCGICFSSFENLLRLKAHYKENHGQNENMGTPGARGRGRHPKSSDTDSESDDGTSSGTGSYVDLEDEKINDSADEFEESDAPRGTKSRQPSLTNQSIESVKWNDWASQGGGRSQKVREEKSEPDAHITSRLRGRPRKVREEEEMDQSTRNRAHGNEGTPGARGRGRPPKSSDTDSETDDGTSSDSCSYVDLEDEEINDSTDPHCVNGVMEFEESRQTSSTNQSRESVKWNDWASQGGGRSQKVREEKSRLRGRPRKVREEEEMNESTRNRAHENEGSSGARGRCKSPKRMNEKCNSIMDCRTVNDMNPYVNLGERILVNDYDQIVNNRIHVETATINTIDSYKCAPTEHSCSNKTDHRNSLLLKHFCGICFSSFENLLSLKEHYKENHGQNENKGTPGARGRGRPPKRCLR